MLRMFEPPVALQFKRSVIYDVFAFLLLSLLTTVPCRAQQQVNPTKDIEAYYDLRFTPAERDSLLDDLTDQQNLYRNLHSYTLSNSAPMSLLFDPYPAGFQPAERQEPIAWEVPKNISVPANREELVFLPVYELATLVRQRKITSVELTRLYLTRLKKFSDTLQCTITLLEERAMEHAREADTEIASGKYRGPLHGIPYGIKDLLAVGGTKTTWGASPYRDQVIDETATVVERLDEAGAVLVAKLTMGALAMGDTWYGGITKNPWDLMQGSSGSSAGSASATAAGLVAFAIGTETWGSIVSPSTRCGVTGLRPTYGRVSRHGAMALSWSMDKIGPICRCALDCALVFEVIRGSDGLDLTVQDAPFNYDARLPVSKLKVGFLKNLFDKDTLHRKNNEEALKVLHELGVTPMPVELPLNMPVQALSIILSAEAAAAFDELTRSDRDSLLVNQGKGAWPNTFRAARFIPAVEYVNATRIRSDLIQAYYEKTKDFDVIVAPSFGGDQLLMTNLTGHPCLVVPDGFDENGHPTSITFLGKLLGEAALITIGRAYQEATPWDEMTPEHFKP